jgi:hypothetical protein
MVHGGEICGIACWMRSVGRLRWLAVAGLAWIGIALGHLVTCTVVHHEHEPPFPPMHSWVPLGAVVAIGAIPAVLVITVLHTLRSDRGFRARPTVRTLSAIQLPMFLALEILERVVAPEPITPEPGILVGIMIQVAAVLVGALLLAALVRVVRALSRPRPEPSEAEESPGLPVVYRRPAHLVLLISSRRRAPPPRLAA